MRRFNEILKITCCGIVLLATGPRVFASEIDVQLSYPGRTESLILTDVSAGEIVFRPPGRDTGGRAYLAIEALIQQRAVLLFPLPQSYYTAVDQLAQGNYSVALPAIETHAAPLLDYLSLASLPGNLMPTVLSYLEVLEGSKQWHAAVDVAVRIPLTGAPPQAYEALSQLALALYSAGETDHLDRLHNRILGLAGLGPDASHTAMRLADDWRERGEFLRAFQLYRNIQASEGPSQTIAQLWVAYCSFYLGHDLVPEVFLDVLPELQTGDPGYSLRELVRARLSMRDGDLDAAMRHAAVGKTYANPIDPWYPELLYTVAHLYEARGMQDAARAAYREVAAIFNESPWAAESEQALESLTSDQYSL